MSALESGTAGHAAPYTTLNEYRAAVTAARAAAEAYYRGDDLKLDDAEYDALLARISATEGTHPRWAGPQSPAQTVGAGVAVSGDVTHSTSMLSLDNVFDADGLRSWAARLDRVLGRAAAGYTVEPKIDGMAIAARYADGRLVQVATRGDGRAGEDVTTQARLIAGLPQQLPDPVTVEVRGEVFMTDADFVTANELRTAHGGQPFANPRNAAAGTLRAQDRAYDAPLSFLAYSVPVISASRPRRHSEVLEAIGALGIATTAKSTAGMQHCLTIDDVTHAVATLGSRRGQLGFPVDGAVVKADDPDDRDTAGSSSRAPRWAIAYKFPADTRTTRLTGIDVQVGRTGVITPVAVLEPVQVGGVSVTSATLHNFDDLVRRDVRIGDTVFVRRAGDVIPEITGAKLDARPADAMPFTAPLVCPRCGGAIDRTQKRWRCVQGRACGAGESLAYFAARDSMDIEGLGTKIIDALVAARLVTDPGDLYDLDVDTLAGIDRLGRTSAAKLVANIQASTSQPLARVVTGLGVRMTGRSMSRRLAQHFASMQALCDATVEQLQQVDGVGPERAAAIAAELADLTPVIAKLAAHGVTMSNPAADSPTPGATEPARLPLRKIDGAPMTVVVTGSVPGLTRTEGNEAVERLGGTSSGSVSRRTDLVVVGDGAGSKAAKADDLGVPVMTADAFAELIAAHSRGDHDAAAKLLP